MTEPMRNDYHSLHYLVNHGADLDIMDDKYNMAIDYTKLCKNNNVFNLIHYNILYEELKMDQKDYIGVHLHKHHTVKKRSFKCQRQHQW